MDHDDTSSARSRRRFGVVFGKSKSFLESN